MQRLMYRGQIKGNTGNELKNALGQCREKVRELVDDGILMTFTLYKYHDQLYLYYECLTEEVKPEELLEPLNQFLECWPGTPEFRIWVPMHDIFHYDKPANPEQWKRRLTVEKRQGRLAWIKPEMLASYIFYHYQLQEERRDTGNKYCIIGLYENLIFHYEEHPVDNSAPSFLGSLTTSNSPKDWKKLMDPHFIPQTNAIGETVNFIVLEPLISC